MNKTKSRKSNNKRMKSTRKNTIKHSTNIRCEKGYCVKCREKRMMENCHIQKNMLKGTCQKCSTKMNRFIKLN